MKIYMLRGKDGWYQKGNSWFAGFVTNPQEASVWNSRNGPNGARARLSKDYGNRRKPVPTTIIQEFEVDVT